MTEYITEIQRQLVENYGYKKGDNGCPQDVPDGAYPMLIEEKLDLVMVVNGHIWCCNFITDKGGLKEFQKKARGQYAKKPNTESPHNLDANRIEQAILTTTEQWMEKDL